MDDSIVPQRLYHVQLLNEDIQKRNEDIFTAANVRINGQILECERVYTDVPFKIKMFYKGEFLLTELDPTEVEEFNNPHQCDHDHEGED